MLRILLLLKKPVFTVFLFRLYASGSSVLPAIQFPGVSPQPLLSIKDDELKAGTESGCSAAVLLPLIRMIKCTASSQSPNVARASGHEDARGNQVLERRRLPSRCSHTLQNASLNSFFDRHIWLLCYPLSVICAHRLDVAFTLQQNTLYSWCSLHESSSLHCKQKIMFLYSRVKSDPSIVSVYKSFSVWLTRSQRILNSNA